MFSHRPGADVLTCCLFTPSVARYNEGRVHDVPVAHMSWVPVDEADEEAPARAGEGVAVGNATIAWLKAHATAGLKSLYRLWLSPQHERLAIILLGPAPSDAARGIFEAVVATAGWSQSRKAVVAFEALSREECEHVQIDAVIANTSLDEAKTWVQLAMALVGYADCLPPLPQRTDPAGLRSRVADAGIFLVIIAAYAPLLAGEDSPHLLNDSDGNVKATSFAWLLRACAYYAAQCGLDASSLGFDPLVQGVIDCGPLGLGLGLRIDRVGVRVKVRLGLGHIGLDLGLERGLQG